MTINPPTSDTIQSWTTSIGLIVTAVGTVAILVQQQVSKLLSARRDQQLNVKTDAQSAKIDEMHNVTVNSSTKLPVAPGGDALPIPKGDIVGAKP